MNAQQRAAVEQWSNAELTALKRTALPLTEPVTDDEIEVAFDALDLLRESTTVDEMRRALEGFAAGRAAGVEAEPYGWKVDGVSRLYMGEHAELDAKKRGGTCWRDLQGISALHSAPARGTGAHDTLADQFNDQHHGRIRRRLRRCDCAGHGKTPRHNG